MEAIFGSQGSPCRILEGNAVGFTPSTLAQPDNHDLTCALCQFFATCRGIKWVCQGYMLSVCIYGLFYNFYNRLYYFEWPQSPYLLC